MRQALTCSKKYCVPNVRVQRRYAKQAGTCQKDWDVLAETCELGLLSNGESCFHYERWAFKPVTDNEKLSFATPYGTSKRLEQLRIELRRFEATDDGRPRPKVSKSAAGAGSNGRVSTLFLLTINRCCGVPILARSAATISQTAMNSEPIRRSRRSALAWI